jgi:hypothetical protein
MTSKSTFEGEFYRLIGAIRTAHEGVMRLLEDKSHINNRSAQLQEADSRVDQYRQQLEELKVVWSRVPWLP